MSSNQESNLAETFLTIILLTFFGVLFILWVVGVIGLVLLSPLWLLGGI